MRSILFSLLVFLVIFASSCAASRESREVAVQEWIQTAQRPIKVQQHGNWEDFSTMRGHTSYTLIDQSGKVYFAKNVRFKLPEVIE